MLQFGEDKVTGNIFEPVKVAGVKNEDSNHARGYLTPSLGGIKKRRKFGYWILNDKRERERERESQ